MAIASADLLQLWSSTTAAELRDETIMLQLTTQAGTDGWVSGASSVKIPAPTWGDPDGSQTEGVKAESRSRGGDWPDEIEIDQGLHTFERRGGYATANKVAWEDALELPWAAVEETRSRQRYAMRWRIDQAIHTTIRALTGVTDTTFGSTTNYIRRTSPFNPATTAAARIPQDILNSFDRQLQRSNANGPGDSVGNRWCLMPPEIFDVFTDGLLEGGYGWDPLTEDLIRNNSVLVEQGYRGRYKGIDVFAFNGLSVPGSAATTRWGVTCGVQGAYAANVRAPVVQYFTPEENQVTDEPAHLLRQAGDWGGVSLHKNLILKASIFKSASDT